MVVGATVVVVAGGTVVVGSTVVAVICFAPVVVVGDDSDAAASSVVSDSLEDAPPMPVPMSSETTLAVARCHVFHMRRLGVASDGACSSTVRVSATGQAVATDSTAL